MRTIQITAIRQEYLFKLYSDRKSFYYTNNYDIAATTTITTTTLYLTSFRSCVLAAKVFMKNRW